MHINIDSVKGKEVSPGVLERVLLAEGQSSPGGLKVVHHTLTGGEVEGELDRLGRDIEEMDERPGSEEEFDQTFDSTYERSMETDDVDEEIRSNKEQLDEAFPESPYGHEYNRP